MKNTYVKIINFMLKNIIPFVKTTSRTTKMIVNYVTYDYTTNKFTVTLKDTTIYVSKKQLDKIKQNDTLKVEKVVTKIGNMTFKNFAIV